MVVVFEPTKLLGLAVLLYFLLRGLFFAAAYWGSSSRELRQRVAKHFAPADIERGFEYARRAYGARVARGMLEALVPLALVLTGLGARLADRLRGISFERASQQAAFLAAILVVGLFLIRLPLSYWIGHVVERRFGFSTQSAAGWLVLELKNLAVTVVISAAAAAVWYGILGRFPRAWVLLVPAAFAIFQLAFALLLPQVLLPIYYQRSRLPEGSLRDGVERILARAGIQAREIYAIDASRYSRHTNAFFTGIGPTRGIYLFDTLLEDQPEREVLTVVAHEAGHWRGGHIAKRIAISAAALAVACFLLRLIYPHLAAAGATGFRPLSDPASLPALWLLATLATFFVSPAASAVSRRFEREADRAAVELTQDPEAFAEAHKRLARSNRAQLLPHPLVVFWLYSHPPAIERVEAAERALPR